MLGQSLTLQRSRKFYIPTQRSSPRLGKKYTKVFESISNPKSTNHNPGKYKFLLTLGVARKQTYPRRIVLNNIIFINDSFNILWSFIFTCDVVTSLVATVVCSTSEHEATCKLCLYFFRPLEKNNTFIKTGVPDGLS